MPPRPAPAKRRIFVCASGRKLHLFYYLLSIYYLQHSWYDIPNPNIYHKKERSILTTNEKIAALRAAAKAAGADGVLIMTSVLCFCTAGLSSGIGCNAAGRAANRGDLPHPLQRLSAHP